MSASITGSAWLFCFNSQEKINVFIPPRYLPAALQTEPLPVRDPRLCDGRRPRWQPRGAPRQRSGAPCASGIVSCPPRDFSPTRCAEHGQRLHCGPLAPLGCHDPQPLQGTEEPTVAQGFRAQGSPGPGGTGSAAHAAHTWQMPAADLIPEASRSPRDTDPDTRRHQTCSAGLAAETGRRSLTPSGTDCRAVTPIPDIPAHTASAVFLFLRLTIFFN